MSPDNMAEFLISWPLCHPIPWPAMPCHDTYFSTQTGQPLWTGLISCHSRWCREQDTLWWALWQPRSLQISLRHWPHIPCVGNEKCVYRHGCMFLLTVEAFFFFSLPKKDKNVKIMSEYNVHVLLYWLGDKKRSFTCKCGLKYYQ